MAALISLTAAQVAELVDALVSGTSGESRGGSSPLLGTKRPSALACGRPLRSFNNSLQVDFAVFFAREGLRPSADSASLVGNAFDIGCVRSGVTSPSQDT